MYIYDCICITKNVQFNTIILKFRLFVLFFSIIFTSTHIPEHAVYTHTFSYQIIIIIINAFNIYFIQHCHGNWRFDLSELFEISCIYFSVVSPLHSLCVVVHDWKRMLIVLEYRLPMLLTWAPNTTEATTHIITIYLYLSICLYRSFFSLFRVIYRIFLLIQRNQICIRAAPLSRIGRSLREKWSNLHIQLIEWILFSHTILLRLFKWSALL